MSLLVKFAAFSVSFLKKAYNFSDAVLSGFWLGILGEKNIEKYTDMHYERGTTYSDDQWNLSGLQGWEYDRIKKHFSKARTFLIIGAGGGREVAALRKWGVEVDSYECSRRLVDYGNDFMRRNGIDAKISFLSKNSVPGISKKYDGIIFGWGAYTHIQGSKLRISLLSELKPFCSEQSRIMISFLLKEGQSRQDRIIKSVSNFFRNINNGPKTESGDRLLSYYAHLFDQAEIEYELNEAGFKLIEYYDGEYGCAVALPEPPSASRLSPEGGIFQD